MANPILTCLCAVGIFFCIVFSTYSYFNVLLLTELEKSRKMTQRILETKERYMSLLPDTSDLPRMREPPVTWAKPRSDAWWISFFNDPEWTTNDWLENFRMSKIHFMELCDILRADMEPSSHPVRQPVSTEKRVAIAIYKLASCAEYRTVGNIFGVHKSTVHRCVYRFCNAVCKRMMDYITLPMDEEAQLLANETFQRSKFPQIWGAIDGSHIPITPPRDGYRDFINRKGWASYVLQAVVDSKCLFRNVSCRVPGSQHDATVLKDSAIYQHPERLPQGIKQIDGCDVPIPLMMAGDPAYPLLPWLMKGYVGSSLSAEQESFNVYLSSVRMIVESSFGRLKGRWRILLKRSEVFYKFMPVIVLTCCILHNFCETRKQTYNSYWDRIREELEAQLPQPASRPSDARDESMKVVRDSIASFLAQNFPLRKSFRS